MTAASAIQEARCPTHPEESVLGTCARCGTFFCAHDRRTVGGKDYCAACAARPELDYLEAFRLKYWGKRDIWSWLVGFGGIINLGLGISLLVSGAENLLFALITLGGAAIQACFWAGLPFARLALCFVPIVSMVIGIATRGGSGVGAGVFPLVMTLVIYGDTRNKLFFRQEVSPEALQKAWNLYSNNPQARAGFVLSFFGLLVPPIAVVSLICSLIGLRRVDPDGHPPIGRKGQAIAGIVLSAIGIVWGLALLGLTLSHKL